MNTSTPTGYLINGQRLFAHNRPPLLFFFLFPTPHPLRILYLVVDSSINTIINSKDHANIFQTQIDGILPKGLYPPCLRMADRALLSGYPRDVTFACLHVVDFFSDVCIFIIASEVDNVITGAMASQITSITIVYWTIYSGANQRKHQIS